MNKLQRAWRHHPWLSLAFLLTLLLAVIFVVRVIWVGVYWAGVKEKNPALQAWMTPRYVMHTWDIERRDLKSLLTNNEAEAEQFKDYTLGQIAAVRNQTFNDFSSQLEQQLRHLQTQLDDHGARATEHHVDR